MTEVKDIKDRPFEERVAEVDQWIEDYSREGFVGLLHPEIVRSVLVDLGANFEKLDSKGRKSLSKYSNKRKHLGMEQVWGARRGEFRKWTEQWVEDYETRTGRELPGIVFVDDGTGEKRPSKTEGMRQFFGEITAYAAGCLDFPSLAKRLAARHYNFGRPKDKSEEEGGKREIVVPGYNLNEETGKEIPFAPASFPPNFPLAAWDKIKSWRK